WGISSAAVVEEDGGAMFLRRRRKQLLVNHIHPRFQLINLYPPSRRRILRRELCGGRTITRCRRLVMSWTRNPAVTIRNDTNLKKETLTLEQDPVNPGHLLVAFTFDALVSGRITVVFFAKESEEFQLTATKEDTLQPITFGFEKGIGQKFIQPSGTGVDLSVFEDSELFKEAETDIFPLAIKLEAAPEGGKSSRCMQITQVTYVKEEGEIKPSVIKQFISVNETRYELQDIYGIGDAVDENARKECVICLSEPRDVTVLPCRHVCMCVGCAKELRFQTNLCPVCRQHVERLLKIPLKD
ncbi:unnamed protein product, partial [Brassica oleracea]